MSFVSRHSRSKEWSSSKEKDSVLELVLGGVMSFRLRVWLDDTLTEEVGHEWSLSIKGFGLMWRKGSGGEAKWEP